MRRPTCSLIGVALIATGLLAVTAPAVAQGGDDCSAAPAVGDGSYPVDTTGNTASGVLASGLPPYERGQPDTACENFNGEPDNLSIDEWLAWTAGTSGLYSISTCNAAFYDSKIAVYSGTCAALTALSCNDDGLGCAGFTSELFVSGIANGATYQVQVGGFDVQSIGIGTITIEPVGPAGPELLAGDDAWSTPPGLSVLDLDADPVPAGFFGAGSDAVTGRVTLKGDPLSTAPEGVLGNTDTIVRRLEPTGPLAIGAPVLVPVEIQALSLIGTGPIVVTSNGGQNPEPWIVRLCLSRTQTQPEGSLEITLLHEDGGTFDALLPVVPRLVFTRLSAPPHAADPPLVLDPAPALNLATIDGAWALAGGPAGFDPQLSGVILVQAGVQLDGDCDGSFERATLSSTAFQPGFGWSGCDFQWAFNAASALASLTGFTALPSGDRDEDGWQDACDNCPLDANPGQGDADGNGCGDACPGCSSGGSPGLVHFNEIYLSHEGVDDREFIELIGPENRSLDNLLVLAVEGDGAGAGILDSAIDLTGSSIPADGYFVLGDTGVTNVDLDLGRTNALENGTQTLYLVQTSGPAATAALVSLVGTTLDPERDGVTSIPCLDLETLEVVALSDGAPGDRVFDGAHTNAYGPSTFGSGSPAGIFRGGDFPNPWCASFLDFFVDANLDRPRTPGRANASCGAFFDTYCSASTNSVSASGARISASGSASVSTNDLVLTCSPVPPLQTGVFFHGPLQTLDPLGFPFGEGRRCVAGALVRLMPPVLADASGVLSVAIDSTHPVQGAALVAGATRSFQGWYRDPNCSGPGGTGDCNRDGVDTGFNLTNGLSVTFGR